METHQLCLPLLEVVSDHSNTSARVERWAAKPNLPIVTSLGSSQVLPGRKVEAILGHSDTATDLESYTFCGHCVDVVGKARIHFYFVPLERGFSLRVYRGNLRRDQRLISEKTDHWGVLGAGPSYCSTQAL